VIIVEKPITRAPADWVAASEAERREVIRRFRGQPRTAVVKFKYKAYGLDPLRKALNEIFFFKCAYCESPYGPTQPVAIEHYRPKGRVIDGKRTLRGYYWLAASWDNLFPSCTDCNTARYQDFENGREELRGKGNLFPLASPRTRATGPRARLEREEPLLLNPSSTAATNDPSRHLEFVVDPTDNETNGLVRPALVNGVESEKGRVSIGVLGLDRPRLKEARAKIARRVLFRCRETEAAEILKRRYPNDLDIQAAYARQVEELRSWFTSDMPYLAMVRQLIARRYPALEQLLMPPASPGPTAT